MSSTSVTWAHNIAASLRCYVEKVPSSHCCTILYSNVPLQDFLNTYSEIEKICNCPSAIIPQRKNQPSVPSLDTFSGNWCCCREWLFWVMGELRYFSEFAWRGADQIEQYLGESPFSWRRTGTTNLFHTMFRVVQWSEKDSGMQWNMSNYSVPFLMDHPSVWR